MDSKITARDLTLQILRNRMVFRQVVQHNLRLHNIPMTFEMLQVMNRLWLKNELSQQTLANETAKDKASMTNLINNLEKRGWVNRQPDPNDGRNKMICLTEKGKQLSEEVLPVVKGFYGYITNQFSQEELECCIDVLKKMEEVMQNKWE